VTELLGERPRLFAMVRPMLSAREALRQQGAVLHKMLLQIVRARTVCRRLLSVPGVGPVAALTYATGIDDPARFGRIHRIGQTEICHLSNLVSVRLRLQHRRISAEV
jgi:transposase